MSLLKRILIIVVIVIVVTISSVVYYYSPLFKPFPSLSGKYSVGSEQICWEDKNRNEPHSKETTDFLKPNRKIMAEFWYPSAVDVGSKKKYINNKLELFEKDLSRQFLMPTFLSSLLFSIETPVLKDSPVADLEKPMPVIIISHDYPLMKENYGYIAYELASHGYLVVSIDHTHISGFTYFPDRILVFSSRIDKAISKKKWVEEKSKIMADDIKFAIETLTIGANNPENMFYKKLDLNNIGLIGHGLGGVAALKLGLKLENVKAIVDLDGWSQKSNLQDGKDKPVFVLFASAGSINTGLNAKDVSNKRKAFLEFCSYHKFCFVDMFNGLGHFGFSDFVLLKSPLKKILGIGDIDSYKVIDRVNKAAVSFFNYYLKESQNQAFVDNVSRRSESFKRWLQMRAAVNMTGNQSGLSM
ncbi:hypothetical protein HN446_03220 [bacterium]|nr:hypothetical protein [bacterium]